MSDYTTTPNENELPLFSGPSTASSITVPPWKGRECRAKRVLDELLLGPVFTNRMIEISTHRFACDISTLREAGYKIKTRIVSNSQAVYTLEGFEKTIPVAKGMQEFYLSTKHWKDLARQRKVFDGWKCIRCQSGSNLETHHWHYPLFEETIYDLQTMCGDCHKWIHGVVAVSFPKRVTESVFDLFVEAGWKK